MARKKDFLDEIIEERTRKNPRFPEMLAEAIARRELAQRLVSARLEKGLSQTVVAAAMKTAQSVVSKLEAGADVKLSTVQRYCEAVGQSLMFTIGPRAAKRALPAKKKVASAKARGRSLGRAARLPVR